MKNRTLVTITFLAFIFVCSCKKNAAPPSPTSNMKKMGGMRVWHGARWGTNIYLDTSGVFQYHPYSYAVTDTTFAIGVINDNTIQIFGQTLKYTSSDTAIKTINFKLGDLPPVYTVAYYYMADSIRYNYDDAGIHRDGHIMLVTP